MTLQSFQGEHMGISQENKIVFVPKMDFMDFTNIRGINPVLLVAFYTETLVSSYYIYLLYYRVVQILHQKNYHQPSRRSTHRQSHL